MYSEMLSRPLLKVGCICIDPVPCDPHVKRTKFLSASGEGDSEDKKTEKEIEMGNPLVGGVGYSEPVGENGDTENMEMEEEEEEEEEEGEKMKKEEEEEEETDDYFQDPTAISKSYSDRDLFCISTSNSPVQKLSVSFPSSASH